MSFDAALILAFFILIATLVVMGAVDRVARSRPREKRK